MMELGATSNCLRAIQLQATNSGSSDWSVTKRNGSTTFDRADCITGSSARVGSELRSSWPGVVRCRSQLTSSSGASMTRFCWFLNLCLVLLSTMAAGTRIPTRPGFRRRELLPRGLSQDETILLSWKNSSAYLSANWIQQNGRGSDAVCSWLGIGCGEWRGENRVTTVNLPSLNLSGPLPPRISGLSALQALNFSGNSFAGEIPADLGWLVGLQQLDLSWNLLSGTIPVELFANCASLTYFNVSSNKLTGSLPLELGSCTNLRVVDVGNNSLEGEIPPPLGQLPYLQELIMADNNGFSGSIPDTLLSNCQSFVKLDVAWNQLSGALPPKLGDCANLELLIMQGNYFTGSIPIEFGKLKKLQVLGLGLNNLTETIPEALRNCTSLELLDVGNNDLEGPIPTWLGELPNLHYLTFQLNRFSGTIPVEITTLSGLRYLDISENYMQGSVNPEFGRVASLRLLRLSGNNLTGNIPAELGNLTGLQGLDLSSNWLSGSIPTSFGNLQDLLWLQLGNNTLTGIIPQELSTCSSLMWVNLAHNELTGHIPENFSDAGWDSERVFRMNRQNPWILNGVGECSIISTWSPGQSQYFQNFLDVSNPQKCHSWLPYLMRGGLKLRSNRVTGESQVLSYWQLGRNNLSGPIPNLTNATSLAVLILSENQLKGPIPPEIGDLPLYNLNLSNNRLNGSIPETIGNASLLVTLDVADNDLQGTLPLELGNLNFLVVLNVSHNVKLRGVIPSAGQMTTLGWSPFIGDVNLCFNDTNPLLKNIVENANRTSSCQAKLPALCSKMGSTSSDDQGSDSNGRSNRGFTKATIITVLGCMSTLAILLIVSSCYCMVSNCRKRAAQARIEREKELGLYWGDSFRGAADLLNHIAVASFGMPCVASLTYANLLQATNNFSPANIVGDGGFGIVYKAKLANGTTVAIKKLVPNGPQGPREFQAEMETLGTIQHENLVSLLGYCCYNDDMLLVYEYFMNGSLDDWLYESDEKAASMKWPLRLRIALQTARGLSFLHHECMHMIIHRDMKTSNILLNEDFKAVLTDFGMARIMDIGSTHVSTMVAGTPGYVPPEYFQTWRATTKGDVYSFGVVLLELLAGKRPTGPHFNGRCGSNLIEQTRILVSQGRPDELLDKTVLESGATEQISTFLALAIRCTEETPSLRPTMVEVVHILETIAAMGVFHPSTKLSSV